MTNPHHSQNQPKPSPESQTPHTSGETKPNYAERAPIRTPGWLGWLLFAALLFSVVWLLNRPLGRKEIPTWQDFEQVIKDNGVQPESVVVMNDQINATLKADYQTPAVKKAKEETPVFVEIDGENRDFYYRRLEEMDVAWRDATGGDWVWPLLVGLAPLLLIIGLIVLISIGARRAAQSGPMGGMLGQFGRSQHRVVSKEKVDVTLQDVAGIQEAKAEVQELIQFLKQPDKFQAIGARIPKGVLLQGPPGCGKTILARAIAGEADVPFFSISGSEFMEMFVGVGARRVRDLFQQAKQSAPCMIFLDEIDSIGRRRGVEQMAGGAHSEREQTLNAILSEMDGFEPNDQVIVIAATNRPDVLDPALTRRGRLDRQVDVPLPDLLGRREILKIHVRKIKLSDDVSLEELARATPMFSGADLAAMVNEAAIFAVMQDKSRVEMADLRQARDKVRFGRARTGRRLDEEQRVCSAYHEAGHALLQATLDHADPIEKVTIIPRGRAMGGTFALPEKDRYGVTRNYLLATLRVLCGGRIAERRKTGDVSSGAEDDIHKVTELARKMVSEWGMSDRLGFVRFHSDDDQQRIGAANPFSDQTAAEIDEEIRRLASEAHEDAERKLDQEWEKVTAIAEALLEYETLTADDIARLLDGEPLDRPTVEQQLDGPKASHSSSPSSRSTALASH